MFQAKGEDWVFASVGWQQLLCSAVSKLIWASLQPVHFIHACPHLPAFSVHRAVMSLPGDYGQTEVTRSFCFTECKTDRRRPFRKTEFSLCKIVHKKVEAENCWRTQGLFIVGGVWWSGTPAWSQANNSRRCQKASVACDRLLMWVCRHWSLESWDKHQISIQSYCGKASGS